MRIWIPLGALVIAACSSSPNDTEPTGTGGKNLGGSTVTGGSGSGGKMGTGGSVGEGGTSNAGGSQGSGGKPGTGGTKATGGTIGSGGTNRVDGGMGTGGTTVIGGAGAGGISGTGGTTGLDAGIKDFGSKETSPDSGGEAGSVTFDPCPASDPCKILPLGDSITFGIGYEGSYRVKLFSLALGAKQNITFTGSQKNGPTTVDGQSFPRNHEGTSGITIADLQKKVPKPAMDTAGGGIPHIILLHVGTNDMYGSSPSSAPDRLGKMIDQVVASAPDALLVVSSIIPFPQGASAVDAYNKAVPGVVQKSASAGKHVIYVDQFKNFPTTELGDGVHPNQKGYERMAGVWYEAIKSYLH
jgi:lysophospholipase L1-like esterase